MRKQNRPFSPSNPLFQAENFFDWDFLGRSVDATCALISDIERADIARENMFLI